APGRGGMPLVAAMARLPATMAVQAVGWPRGGAASAGELVADAVYGQQVLRVSWIRFDLAPHVLDVRVDRAIERGGVDAANGVEQLGAREYAPGLRGHGRQQGELGRCQVDHAIAGARLHAPLVEAEVAGADGVAALRRRVDAPEHGLHARHEL